MQNNYKIREIREEEGLTQRKIADSLFMKLEVYRRYEVGEREIPLNIAIMLAEFYNISLDYIAGLTNEKRPLRPLR